jgi:hypothetical protein
MAITNFIPAIWSAALLESFFASQVVIPTCNRQYEGDASMGNEVKITGVNTPAIQNYATTHTHTIDQLTDTTQSLLINQEKAVAFAVDDVDRVQAAGSFEPVTAAAGSALSEDAETYVITQMSTNGTSVSTAAIADAAAAYASVLNMRKALSKAKVPSAGRYLLVNPEFSALLLGSDSKLSSVDSAGSDGELRNGVLGRLLGFTVLESPLLVNSNRAAAIGYHGASVGHVSQISKTEAGRQELAFADYVKSLHVYGSKVLRATSVQTHLAAA